MNSVEINCVDTFFEAVEWCEENLSCNDWSLHNMHWPAERYSIEFTDPTTATMFALKWC